MIQNDDEHRVMQTAATMLRAVIALLEACPPGEGVSPQSHEARLEAMRVQLEAIEDELRAYERTQE